jgi:hypothetical protein
MPLKTIRDSAENCALMKIQSFATFGRELSRLLQEAHLFSFHNGYEAHQRSGVSPAPTACRRLLGISGKFYF